MEKKKYNKEYIKNMIKQYDNEHKMTNITIKDFALKNNINKNTFWGWIWRYRKKHANFNNITQEVINTGTNYNNNLKLHCNGVTIEFDGEFIEKIMEIVKSW